MILKSPIRLLASLVSFVVLCHARADVSPQSMYQNVAAQLQQMIQQEMQNQKLPAVSIVLIDDQQPVWAQGFGLADPVQKVSATADTIYRVGSVSKLFTDTAIMQLVEKGELNLDAPIQQYLPEFQPKNPFGKPITLRELMSHRSGLVREPPIGHYFDSTDPSLKATVESLNSTTLIYPPESHIKYSNAAIAVVGYVLEHRSGQPFTSYVEQAVLKPLGMTSSSFAPNPDILKRLARAYIWTYDLRTFDAPTFQLGMAPAGCMYSSVLDLGKFLSMLFARGQGADGRVLKPETLAQMWQPQFAKPNQSEGFGLGFHLGDLEGHRFVGHGGAIYGFATELYALPEEKLGVAVVTTMDSANSVMSIVAEQALRLMLAAKAGKPLPELVETGPIAPDEAKKWRGRYGSGSDAVDLLEHYGNLLLLPANGGYETTLRRSPKSTSGAANNRASLIVDDRLSYGQEVTVLDDDHIEIDKKNLARTPVPKPPAPPTDWDGLIGEYGWDYDTLYILEKDGHLTSLIEWYEYEPLDQISKDEFRYPQRGLYANEPFVFTRDANGEATQVRVGAVVFKRRPLNAAGSIFRITPAKSVDELRQDALQAQPPKENGNFRQPDLVELTSLDPGIKLDIRYATTNNFLSTPVYTQAKAFMQRPAAEAVARANQELKASGYGLLIHDAYRPWYVTKMFWDATPEDKKIFVANPAEGSRHNRGCAVDLTLYELATGKPVQMVGVYDEMSTRSYPFYPGGTSQQRWLRALLRHAMEKQGFEVYEAEWWHFDYNEWRNYPILNLTFGQLSGSHAAAASR